MSHVPDTAGIALAPDWVCEVTSPSTGRLDRVRKMPRYAHHGVAHLWLIDPAMRTLEVYRLEGGRWVLLSAHGADERVRAVPFDAVELELAALWADLPPEPTAPAAG